MPTITLHGGPLDGAEFEISPDFLADHATTGAVFRLEPSGAQGRYRQFDGRWVWCGPPEPS
ncbi:hypothetical protein [Salinactinospora qingdaonensis]|uniref:Uncharacterized protein n=1 Tax=Salinactinospora qingdaonensis TaxID=702744 RepID=A0ABP7EYB0_9ACTN